MPWTLLLVNRLPDLSRDINIDGARDAFVHLLRAQVCSPEFYYVCVYDTVCRVEEGSHLFGPPLLPPSFSLSLSLSLFLLYVSLLFVSTTDAEVLERGPPPPPLSVDIAGHLSSAPPRLFSPIVAAVSGFL